MPIIKYKNNLCKRFRDKFKGIDFGPKNDLCSPILGIITRFLDNPKLSLLPTFQDLTYSFQKNQ